MPPPFSIAIVDDHASLRKSINTYFSLQGVTVSLEAEHGHDFLVKLENGQVVPDLCLLDINMPVMDGFETARQLKAQYPEIQIMAYSSFSDHKRIAKVLECGAHSFISKDAAPEEVLAALTTLYKSRKEREGVSLS